MVKHFVSSTLAWPLSARPGGVARGVADSGLAICGLSAVTRSAAPDLPALDGLDEAGLIEACRSGRPGAFDVIVERHRRLVYQLCYRFVGNHEDASDLSQDVFLRAYRGLGKFRGGSSLATWLYRIGVNLCLNRVGRKVSATEAIDDRQHIDTRSESAADRVLREERAAQVRRAVAALPPKQRATLILRMYHELSHEEIAGILGSSVGAVKANFFHALGNLKRQLGNGPV
jgi:RNA polymerase sigma-70 factor, ECF subfamily